MQETLNLDHTITWKHSKSLPDDVDFEYGWLYSSGKSLMECCPASLSSSWEQAHKKISSIFRTCVLAKVPLSEHCFYDLVPERDLNNFLHIKSLILKNVFEKYDRPENYEFLKSIYVMLEEISSHSLSVDVGVLNVHNLPSSKKRIYQQQDARAKYNLFGTRTGRLSTVKGSFPVLNFNKDHRDILVPRNDAFVELDYNGAEVRTLLALSGNTQPIEDIHEWNLAHCHGSVATRDEMKERFFAWLYNPDSKDSSLERYYNKRSCHEYWDGHHVYTPFKRKIESDSFHSLNYLIQSTTSDLVLENALKVHQFLKHKKSNISFVVHDSIVLDMDKEDFGYLKSIAAMFEETRYGNYRSSAKIGRNYKDMRKIEWRQ